MPACVFVISYFAVCMWLHVSVFSSCRYTTIMKTFVCHGIFSVTMPRQAVNSTLWPLAHFMLCCDSTSCYISPGQEFTVDPSVSREAWCLFLERLKVKWREEKQWMLSANSQEIYYSVAHWSPRSCFCKPHCGLLLLLLLPLQILWGGGLGIPNTEKELIQPFPKYTHTNAHHTTFG